MWFRGWMFIRWLCWNSSEGESDGGVEEIDVGAGAGVVDEIAGEEVGVAEVGGEVAIDLPIDHGVEFVAEVGFVGGGAEADDAAGEVVDGIVGILTPEEMLVELKGDGRGEVEDQAGVEVDDVFAAEDVDVAEVVVGGGEKLVEAMGGISRAGGGVESEGGAGGEGHLRECVAGFGGDGPGADGVAVEFAELAVELQVEIPRLGRGVEAGAEGVCRRINGVELGLLFVEGEDVEIELGMGALEEIWQGGDVVDAGKPGAFIFAVERFFVDVDGADQEYIKDIVGSGEGELCAVESAADVDPVVGADEALSAVD